MRTKYISYLILTVTFVFSGISCSDSFLEQPPPGAYAETSLRNLKGVEGMLIAAYSMLDGSYFESWGNNYFNQNAGASNWIWGGMLSEDAYKGTEPSDGVDLNPIETYIAQPSNPYFLNKWTGSYDGISRANQCLNTLKASLDVIGAADATRIEGEARFLRAHYHFELAKVFAVIPFVDETLTTDDLDNVTNDVLPWAKIEEDLQFGYDNLPIVQTAAGRANKWAAAALLAKVKIFQAKWAEALPILNDVIQNGVTAEGVPYDLMPNFSDNYRVAKEKGSSEMVFSYEASVFDGSIANGSYETTLNMPHGSSAKTGCCGFYQPSQHLVNSFKVDGSGLPLFDTYNATDFKNDASVPSNQPFDPDDTTPIDPRLDHTVGRRGIPYMDWGLHPGRDWIRDVNNGGPYSPKKNVPSLAEFDAGTAGVIDWGFTSTAQNVHIIRFADVLLWAAECEAEIGSLTNAATLVNQIRTRAGNERVQNGSVDAANYQIGLYAVPFASRAEALRAIRFERKLEFAMEGVRYFDLVRWDNASKGFGQGTQLSFDIVSYINTEYLANETERSHLAGVSYTAKYKYMPIPEYAITQSTVGGVRNLDQSTDWGGTRNYLTGG